MNRLRTALRRLKREFLWQRARLLGYACDGGNTAIKNGGSCEVEECKSCCPHDDVEHFVCLYCEKEFDPGAAIDAAMDYFD